MTQDRREGAAVGKEAEGKEAVRKEAEGTEAEGTEAEGTVQSYRLFFYRLLTYRLLTYRLFTYRGFRPSRYLPPSYPMSGCPAHTPRKEPVLNAESTRTRAVRRGFSSSSSRDGNPAIRIQESVAAAPTQLEALAEAIDLRTVTRELEAEGVAKFAGSHAAVLTGIDAKAGALAAR
jgi:hypothetical protein